MTEAAANHTFDNPLAYEAWQVTKPAKTGRQGMVASQHYLASRVGTAMLAAGGNAVDAALAAGFAISTVEPWMSGLGGGGFMLVYLAKENRVKAVQFGMQAPHGLDPADYPLTGKVAADLFGWPEVLENRHVKGPYSIATPGYVAGAAAALAAFGSKSWSEILAPAVAMAETGMLVDWYATLKIATAAADLAKYPASAAQYLPGGYPPSGEWGGEPPRLWLGRLAQTLKRLSAAGPGDFYEGEIAAKIAEDAAAAGASLRASDLAAYEASITDAEIWQYREATVYGAPGLSAGPTLRHAQELLRQSLQDEALKHGGRPEPETYAGYAASLLAAYEHRLATLGQADESKAPSCTTHLSVIDGDGNMVVLTQTLLSLFGSKVVLPQTGITMNNGIMWFDPRADHPNAIAPGKRPLSNMCPTIVVENGGRRYGLGASGGRRIMPAVFQLISYLSDFGMSIDEAVHRGRIDVSGSDLVSVDPRLGRAVHDALASRFNVQAAQNATFPAIYACPNIVSMDPSGEMAGAAFIASPWSEVAVV